MAHREARRTGRVVPATILTLAMSVALLTETALPAAAADAIAIPSTGTLFGAYTKPMTGWAKADVQAAVSGLESDLGRTLDIDHHYYPWGTNFPSWKETWDRDNGRSSMISWGGTYSSEINAGDHDAWMQARADAVRAFGSDVLIRYFWEVDADPTAPKAGSPADFIAAWRRIHGIFESRGATNVQWVFCPTAWSFATGEAQSYYPGDGYVDWICADGYNWAPQRPNTNWTSFQQIFAPFYNWASTKAKPLMVGETGTEERNPGEKAAWFNGARSTLKNTYPKIKAFMYFNSIASAWFGGEYEWIVNSSTSSYNAYKDMAADPFFNTRTVAPPDPPDPPDPPATFQLTVTASAGGTVTSEPAGITCQQGSVTGCSGEFDNGSDVTLTPASDEGYRPAGWTGACADSGASCTLAMTKSRTAGAAFIEELPHRPDAAVGTSAARLVGEAVVNTDGAQQTAFSRIRRRRSKRFVLALQNTGISDDALAVQGPGRAGKFRIRYFDNGVNVTAAVADGTYLSPTLSQDQEHRLDIVVKPKRRARRGRASFGLTVTSVGDPSRLDVPRIKVVLRRRG
jgi:hypothetical protein